MAHTTSEPGLAEQSSVITVLYVVGTVVMALVASASTITGSLALPYYQGMLLGRAVGGLVIPIAFAFVGARAWRGDLALWAKWTFWVSMVGHLLVVANSPDR